MRLATYIDSHRLQIKSLACRQSSARRLHNTQSMTPETENQKQTVNNNCSKTDTSINDLIIRAQKGERGAVERLLQEARPRAIAVAMKVLRNPSDAEDAVQDATIKIWRYLPRFEGRASFFTWVHRIVMNSSLDIMRREKLRSEPREYDGDDLSEVGSHEPSHGRTPEVELASAETRQVVRAAMAVLSPVHRDALQLREFEDFSYDEIAERSDCPVGTVMSRLHHARRRLADELRTFSVTDDAWMPNAA